MGQIRLEDSTFFNSVPTQSDVNVLVGELGHGIFRRSYISEKKIKDIATEKYRSSGDGITFKDLITRLSSKKPQAQRSLKHFHERDVLFTAEDLISQGLDLIHNTSPQQYFPTCIRADIIEGLKKRKNVRVQPTGVDPQVVPLFRLPSLFLPSTHFQIVLNIREHSHFWIS